VVVVWVNPIVVVPSDVCTVVSNKPPSIDELDVNDVFIIGDGVSTDVLVLRFYPVCLSFDFGWEVVFKTWVYDVYGICIRTVFFSFESNITVVQFDLLAA
jgi:hypothetical protein